MLESLRIDPAFLTERTGQMVSNLRSNRGLSDLSGYACGVVSRRLALAPRRYLDYGPYWWSVKRVLNADGRQMGDYTDPSVESAYRGATDAETMVAAELFRDEYLRTRPLGSADHELTQGETYTLFDPDMAGRLS
jgi:hypothetical protein